MKKTNTLLKTLLICIASIDIIWFFFSDLTFRRYTMLLPIPLLVLFYFLKKDTKSVLYLAALASFMVADYFFRIEGGQFIEGVVATSVGIGLYGIIVLINSHYISTRRILISTVPFLGIYMIPFVFFIEKIPDDIFSQIVAYTFAIGYFSFLTILTYVSKPSLVTKKLLIAGISTICMGILYGIFLFVYTNRIVGIGANILFMVSNYSMWRYMMIKDTQAKEEIILR
ncbi:hypothetical protein H2O64_15910 [Kordia sp. YSTF-M3]|uniref:YhhN-like protein n=1 Tax=Kordia aestuariivivens TaxID=2759037 RepID=A0ABR7QC62_9FLAO|nr:hypothetical protein [Kordia aestuariivivens]MBC8756162.1 hypothetical protein [Kordia aestuariivivens]